MTWSASNKQGKLPTWVRNPLARPGRRSVDDLKALPAGTVLRFELGNGLQVIAGRTNENRWLLHSGGIDVEHLGDLIAVEMRRRGQ